jgi:hypothetical protein
LNRLFGRHSVADGSQFHKIFGSRRTLTQTALDILPASALGYSLSSIKRRQGGEGAALESRQKVRVAMWFDGVAKFSCGCESRADML